MPFGSVTELTELGYPLKEPVIALGLWATHQVKNGSAKAPMARILRTKDGHELGVNPLHSYAVD